MEVHRTPRLVRALRITHPFPTLVNVLTTGGLALVAKRSGAPTLAVAHLMLAMLAIQACIGIVNDIVDRDLDEASKPAKPLIEGSLTVWTARAVAIATFVAAALLSTGFGLAAWLLAMAGLGCGLAYDLRLKRTPASALPFVFGLPLLPLWIWVALGRFQPRLLMLVPLGLLLGLSLHLANSLPDFETDASAGIRGLAHALGKKHALALCWGTYGMVLLLIDASGIALGARMVLLLPGVGAGTLCLLAAILLFWRRPSRASLQTGWGLLTAGGVAAALAWLGALPLH